MANSFGVSFLPGSGEQDQTQRPGGVSPRNPVQEAVQILSLRLPKMFGARSIAPAPLLTSPGGMGAPGARDNVSAALMALSGMPPTTDWMGRERDMSRSGGDGGSNLGGLTFSGGLQPGPTSNRGEGFQWHSVPEQSVSGPDPSPTYGLPNIGFQQPTAPEPAPLPQPQTAQASASDWEGPDRQQLMQELWDRINAGRVWD